MIHAEPCIVFEDGGLIALDKPPGLLSTGRQRDDADSAEGWLRALLGREVWALHQLDRDTSGLLLFVTRRTLVEPWQRRLAHRRTHKRYLAVVHG
ncbi:MAG: pseudouridine synthase, partial [Myxococcota bacterium]